MISEVVPLHPPSSVLKQKLGTTRDEFWLAQRTDEWFRQRETVPGFPGMNPITGSSLGNVVGFWKDRQEEYWNWIHGGEKLELPESSMVACEHGTKYEPVACQRYADSLSAKEDVDVRVYEVGAARVHDWMLISADGLASFGNDWCAVEIKCPWKGGKMTSHFNIPPYYMPQIQAHCAALDVPSCHFVSYGVADGSLKVWAVPRERNLWAKIYDLSLYFFASQSYTEVDQLEMQAARSSVVNQCRAVSYACQSNMIICEKNK
jgi:hypothetical protein